MRKILDIFSSVKLTLWLMVLIIILSSIGSFISVSNPDSGILGLVSKLTGMGHQDVMAIFDKMGLLDAYHSSLFIGMLILFTINLTVCTFYKLPNILKFLKSEVKVNKAVFEKQGCIKIEKDIDVKSLKDRLDEIFKRYKIAEERDGDKYFFTAEKGGFSRVGVYVVHLGIIVILISGILGGIFGYNGKIAILEGDTDDTIILKDNKTLKLPFNIKLNEFSVSYYDNSTKAKEYKSEIIISKKDKPDEAFVVGVNKQAKYENLKIYQASYGFYPSKDVTFRFLFKANGVEKKIQVKMDEVYRINENLSFAVRDFAPSLSLDSEGRLINLNDMMVNPAVVVEFFVDNESKGSVPILANYQQTGIFDGFELHFLKAYGVQFSVFSINYNPVINLIYIGFIILSVGIFISFSTEHQLVYIRITPVQDRSVVELCGYKHRFKKDVARMLNEIADKI
ncbi:cytochrome c biogenesis protein ResB [Calditerrivibrio nitroreducens]|uniref:ResB-like domain-containing protein n=1 Tax=Calditerrivibrio nitroreducens (strain DSM 19672 / NBRC 101217 / Yu37-1) TaxID=768670 RepID=E4TEZ2_CALNY|nr:cytochrome c biogenesis protein ResB [Calditerrivibrio nitroreducens]ADR18398.1 hypothetical protein Calni_0485 [Calditerrivibrio nitroreducens DSM 19672]